MTVAAYHCVHTEHVAYLFSLVNSAKQGEEDDREGKRKRKRAFYFSILLPGKERGTFYFQWNEQE